MLELVTVSVTLSTVLIPLVDALRNAGSDQYRRQISIN
jgi:hypothetical protein